MRRPRPVAGADRVEQLRQTGGAPGRHVEGRLLVVAPAPEHLVVALSNADPAEIAGFSLRGGLAWHLALSTRPSQAFKPDPRAYRVALDALELDAGAVMMVAAHTWDLQGAAETGFRTAYVQRPDEGPPGADFELVVDDLDELADRLQGS